MDGSVNPIRDKETIDIELQLKDLETTEKKLNLYHIDTAMFVVNLSLIKNIRWKMKIHETDYYFIKKCLKTNKNRYVHINKVGCYYNYLCDKFLKRNIKRFN